MNAFPFRADIKLTSFLKSHPFTVSAEVIPPRNGAEQAKVLGQIQSLVGAGAQFLAVTKGAGGSLRGGSLPIAQAIKEQFKVPSIAHFTCRDLLPEEVENLLMDHHYFGIRNILALRGDAPDGGAHWVPKAGGYSYAHELMNQIRNLNQGIYLTRQGGPVADGAEKTDFCIGAAVYPDFPDEAQRIEYFKCKADAGAEYAITDLLFDVDSYLRFRDQAAKAGIHIPILPGTRILKSQKQALRAADKFKCHIPKEFIASLPEIEPSAEAGLDLFYKMVDRLKEHGAPGIHLFVISDTPAASQAIQTLVSEPGRAPRS